MSFLCPSPGPSLITTPRLTPLRLLPVAVLGLFRHACQWWLEAAQVVIELAGVTEHQQMLILVLLTDATATGEMHEMAQELEFCNVKMLKYTPSLMV